MNMTTITTKNEDDPLNFEIKENSYYWYFITNSNVFKFIKVISIHTKEYIYLDCKIYFENEFNLTILEDSEQKKIPLKERVNFKYFDTAQINPSLTDLSMLPSISYPAILLNLKFRRERGSLFTRAGKLLIGVNIKEIGMEKEIIKEARNVSESIDEEGNQTIIINGLPNTGKNIFTEYLIEDLVMERYKSGYSKYLNEIVKKSITLLEIFGNCIEGKLFQQLNNNRYMRKIKLLIKTQQNVETIFKFKIKHFLFEKNRPIIFEESENKFNFHIFHALIEGLNEIFVRKKRNVDEPIHKYIISEYAFLANSADILTTVYKTNNLKIFHQFETVLSNTNSENKFLPVLNLNEFFLKKLSLFFNLMSDLKLAGKKTFKKVLNLLLSIILLQQIHFETDEDGKSFLDDNLDLLVMITKLLECDKKLFRDKLISREIKSPRGSFYVVRFSTEESYRARNNLIKILYENLFCFITRAVNISINELISKQDDNMNQKDGVANSIKYLNIVECFGFENSSLAGENSLDNLFVNYTNDKLSNLLFDMSIKAETELYKSEGIIGDSDLNLDFKKQSSSVSSITSSVAKPRASTIKINYNKNNGLLDVDIENTLFACDDNNKGIFKLIDVQSSLINSNKGVIKALCDNIKLSWPMLTTTNDSFYLVHFGSVVEYGASDFVFKNIDTVYDDLKEIALGFLKKLGKYYVLQNYEHDKIKMNSVNSYLLKELNQDDNARDREKMPSNSLSEKSSATRRFSQNMKLKSNSEKFLNKMKKLILKIKFTKLKFVKLICTSNPNLFDEKFTLQQLYSSGIFESILLAKGGFFIRHNFENLMKRLRTFENFILFENKSAFINSVSQILKIDSDNIIIGKSLLFVKNQALFKNRELITCNHLPSFIINSIFRKIMKRFVKTVKCFKYFLNLLKKARINILANNLEGLIIRNSKKQALLNMSMFIENKNDSATRIQTHFKKFKNNKFEKKEKCIQSARNLFNLIETKFKHAFFHKFEEHAKIRNKAITQIQIKFRNFFEDKKIRIERFQTFRRNVRIKSVNLSAKQQVFDKFHKTSTLKSSTSFIQKIFRKFIFRKKEKINLFWKLNLCIIRLTKSFFMSNLKKLAHFKDVRASQIQHAFNSHTQRKKLTVKHKLCEKIVDAVSRNVKLSVLNKLKYSKLKTMNAIKNQQKSIYNNKVQILSIGINSVIIRNKYRLLINCLVLISELKNKAANQIQYYLKKLKACKLSKTTKMCGTIKNILTKHIFTKLIFPNHKIDNSFEIKETAINLYQNIKSNENLRNSSAIRIQRSYLRHFQKSKNNITIKKLFTNLFTKLSLKTFSIRYLKFLTLQKYIKQFVIKINKRNLQTLFLLLEFRHRRRLIEDITESFYRINSIKNNLKAKTHEVFTLTDYPVHMIENHTDKEIESEEPIASKQNSSSLKNKATIKSPKKVTEKSIIAKGSKTVGPIAVKPSKKIEDQIKTQSNAKNKSFTSVKKEDSKSIVQKRNSNYNVHDQLSKMKDSNEFFENCSNELDHLLKEIHNDIDKLKTVKTNEVDYKQLNKDKKIKTSYCKIEQEAKQPGQECGHRHSHDHCSGNDLVQFKKLCYSDKLKK